MLANVEHSLDLSSEPTTRAKGSCVRVSLAWVCAGSSGLTQEQHWGKQQEPTEEGRGWTLGTQHGHGRGRGLRSLAEQEEVWMEADARPSPPSHLSGEGSNKEDRSPLAGADRDGR